MSILIFSLENNLPEDKVDEEQQLVDGSAALDDDHVQDGEDGVDPLMFIQVGQVESNYADFDKEDETEENQVFIPLCLRLRNLCWKEAIIKI